MARAIGDRVRGGETLLTGSDGRRCVVLDFAHADFPGIRFVYRAKAPADDRHELIWLIEELADRRCSHWLMRAGASSHDGGRTVWIRLDGQRLRDASPGPRGRPSRRRHTMSGAMSPSIQPRSVGAAPTTTPTTGQAGAMTMEVLFASVPVADLQTALEWYGRVFARPADIVPNEHEVMWRVAGSGWLYVIEDRARAGHTVVAILGRRPSPLRRRARQPGPHDRADRDRWRRSVQGDPRRRGRERPQLHRGRPQLIVGRSGRGSAEPAAGAGHPAGGSRSRRESASDAPRRRAAAPRDHPSQHRGDARPGRVRTCRNDSRKATARDGDPRREARIAAAGRRAQASMTARRR